jgi:hypothetical protein
MKDSGRVESMFGFIASNHSKSKNIVVLGVVVVVVV